MPVKLLNQDAHLLFDTGGAVRSLTYDAAQRLGLKTHTGTIKLRNLKGKTSQLSTTVPSIIFGDAEVKDITFLILPKGQNAERVITRETYESVKQTLGDKFEDKATREAALKAAAVDAYDGVLALDLFEAVDYDLDFANKKLTLFSDKHCPGKVLYWPADVIAEVPFEFVGEHITFPVTLDGVTLRAVLDTGASASNVNLTLPKAICTWI